jgi:hypothetical protein
MPCMVPPFVNAHGKAEDGPYRCLCCGFLSLTEARQNFQAIGVCDERCTAFVREPLPGEHPAF